MFCGFSIYADSNWFVLSNYVVGRIAFQDFPHITFGTILMFC